MVAELSAYTRLLLWKCPEVVSRFRGVLLHDTMGITARSKQAVDNIRDVSDIVTFRLCELIPFSDARLEGFLAWVC